MASGSIFLDGVDKAIEDFDRITGDIDKETLTALNESLSVIEQQMKANARSVFTDGYTQGVMVNSISHIAKINDNNTVTGSVGVYDMSRKTGSTDRRLPEPVLAYMYEFGIDPHYTTENNKPAGANGKEARIHQGSAPRPFLSSAFDANSANIFTTIVDRLNKSIDKK